MSMKAILLYFIISTFNLSFVNCIGNPFAESELPKEMPENVRMKFSENGGMAPEWHSIEISDDEILITDKKMDDDTEKKWFAKISKEDKANLYKIFVENKLDLIENDKQKEIVYDAGSEGIYIRAGNVSKNVSYGMNSPLSGRNLSRYSAVKKAIVDLEKKYITKSKQVSDNFAVINYNPQKHNFIFENAKPTKLNQSEIQKVESIVSKTIGKYNEKQINALKIKDLGKYKRQFIPVINEGGKKIVWGNYFCRANKNWKREILVVMDGGNCYFNVFVNLTKSESEKLSVNGEA